MIFFDSSGNPVEYNYSGYLNDYPHPTHEQLFSVTLPTAAENKILVQLRWKYYFIPNDNASGTRPKMKVDDIIVDGEMINSIQDEISPAYGIVSIFPNPANDKIEVKLFSQTGSNTCLNITNLIGTEIISIDNYKIEPGENRIELDISGYKLESGVFLICIKSTMGFDCRKFIFMK